jgi:predicted N-acetyltransferase YhbS
MSETTANPTIRAATPRDDPALFALWAAAFAAPLMKPMWLLDPDRHAHTLLVVEPGGTVAASIVSLPRTLRGIDGGVDKVAGIANVATHPNARGRGYARQLLVGAVERAHEDGSDWALLFTGTPGVYTRVGWSGFTQRHREGTILPLSDHTKPSTAAVTAGSFEQWPTLAPLHEATIARHPLATIRSEFDWQRTALWHSRATLLIAAPPAFHTPPTPIGYLVVDTTPDDAAWVVELAAPDDEVAAALMDRAVLLAHDAGKSRLLLRTPDTPQSEMLAHHFLTEVRWREDTTGMTHPIARSASEVLDTVGAPAAYHGTGDYL